MAIRVYKPTSPGRRDMSVATFEEITRTSPEKSLVRPIKKKGGRNFRGKITVRHRGGGHKRRYRADRFQTGQVRCSRASSVYRVRSQSIGTHCPRCTMSTAKSDTWSPRWVSWLATWSCLAPMPKSGWGTPYRCPTSHSGLWFTTSSSTWARGGNWSGQPEPRPSCWQKRDVM